MTSAGTIFAKTGVLMVTKVQLLQGAVQLVEISFILWGFFRADARKLMIVGNVLLTHVRQPERRGLLIG